MESFLKVCADTEKKLGRRLQKKETDFLQWMFERYEKEQKGKRKIGGITE